MSSTEVVKSSVEPLNKKRRVAAISEEKAGDVAESAGPCRRRTRLDAWRKNQEEKKKISQRSKKPPFVVGIYHPPINPFPAIPLPPAKVANKKKPKISKATVKRLQHKSKKIKSPVKNKIFKVLELNNATFSKDEIPAIIPVSSVNWTPSNTETIAKRITNLGCIAEEDEEEEILGCNRTFEVTKPKTSGPQKQAEEADFESLPGSSLKIKGKPRASSTPNSSTDLKNVFGSIQENEKNVETSDPKENLQSTTLPLEGDTPFKKSERRSMDMAAMFSPYITTSRGKTNCRKEQSLRLRLSRKSTSEENIPMKDTVIQNLNISVEEEQKLAKYFKMLVENEIDRLNGLCDKWEAVMNEIENESAKDMINSAIGHTKLLLRKKIQRFCGLVVQCEEGKGEQVVTSTDLRGFWDMTYIEIEDCNRRFQGLDDFQSKDWAEPDESGPKKVPQAKKKKTGQQKNTKKISAEQSKKPAKSSFRDFLKKQKEANKQQANVPDEVEVLEENTKAIDEIDLFAIIDTKPDKSISYINSNQTPGRSILKKRDQTLGPNVRTSHKVNFNDTITKHEICDESGSQDIFSTPEEIPAPKQSPEVKNSGFTGFSRVKSPVPAKGTETKYHLKDCSVILDRISDADMEGVFENVNRKLVFGMDDTLTLLTPNEDHKIRRVLRSSSKTPVWSSEPMKTRRQRRASEEDAENHENCENLSIRNNFRPDQVKIKINESQKSVDAEEEKNTSGLSKNSSSRRSTRKSVKFNTSDDCIKCSLEKKNKKQGTPYLKGVAKKISFVNE